MKGNVHDSEYLAETAAVTNSFVLEGADKLVDVILFD